MQHLETERIAAFDHEAFTADELAHLAACTVCRTERNAFAALNQRSMHMADEAAVASAPRLTTWESLSTRLRAEGLIAGDAPTEIVQLSDEEVASNEVRFENVMRALNKPSSVTGSETASQPVAIKSWWQRAKPRSGSEVFRVAAAILIFVTGAGVNQIRNDRANADVEPAGTASASIGDFGLGSTGYPSIDAANKALAQNERDFDRIANFLTANDVSATKTDILRKRLAALDRVIATMHAELLDAPQDIVLEHYYNSAQARREMTLKQLGGALPIGRTLERF